MSLVSRVLGLARAPVSAGVWLALTACATAPPPTPPPPAPRTLAEARVLPPPATIGAEPTTGLETRPAKPPAIQPVVRLGPGNLLGAQRATRPAAADGQNGEVTLNFIDAPVADVVKTVVEEVMGRSFVIDPRITGTVTLQTASPLARTELLPTLDAILRLNGAALVDSGGVVRIVPIDEVLSSGVRAGLRPSDGTLGPGFQLRVVPLAFASANEVRSILEPFAVGGSVVQVDADRNVLILAGTSDHIRTMLDMIDLFDVDRLKNMSFALLPLRSVDPTTMIADLRGVFPGAAQQEGKGLLQLVPVKRLNAVLAISPQPAFIEEVRRWVERLDRGGEEEEPRLYIYRVQHARAVELAQVLGEAVGAQTSTRTEGGNVPLDPLLGETGFSERGSGSRRRSGRVDRLRGAGGLNSALAALTPERPLLPAQPPTAATGEDGGSKAEVPLRIIANDTDNSMLIYATPRRFRMVEQALRQIDTVPLQVLIEATIAEISLENQLRYGLQWYFRFGGIQLRLSDRPSGSVEPAAPGFAGILANTQDARVVLNALEAVTNVKIVSTPQLLVLDNRTARLQVGDEVPIVTQTGQSALDDNAPVINTIEYRDTGVILEIRPRVNASGLVVLDIVQEVSDVVSTTTSRIDSPTIRQRRIGTSIAAQNGETIALGGLIRDGSEGGSSGLPVLSSLPIIGPLFGTTDRNVARTELLILLTPRVLRNLDDTRAITQELRQRLGAVASPDVTGSRPVPVTP